jgi:hypothetical protein
VVLRLPPLLAVANALRFGSVILLPPLIQLGLHSLQGMPGVLLGRRRGKRGRCWCWCRLRRDDLLRR